MLLIIKSLNQLDCINKLNYLASTNVYYKIKIKKGNK